MIEKSHFGVVQVLESTPMNSLGMKRDKGLQCREEFFNASCSVQSDYQRPDELVISGVGVLLEMVKLKSRRSCSLYLLNCLKEVVEKFKNSINLEDFVGSQFVSSTANFLLDSNERLFSRAQDKEKRTKVFEIIGGCFCEDESDNYLENLQMLADSILAKTRTVSAERLSEVARFDSQDTFVKLAADMTGLMSPVASARVAVSLIRICYPRMRQLFQDVGGQLLTNEAFLQAVMGYYVAMNRFAFDRLSSATTLVYIDVLQDTMRMMAGVGGAVNEKLRNLQGKELVEALKLGSQFFQDSLEIFLEILRKKSVDFCTFQFFGSMVFVNYLGVCFDLIKIILPFLDVRLFFSLVPSRRSRDSPRHFY